jgi:hypothetical protein
VERNGRVVVAGKSLYGHRRSRELLLRFTARGRLDRGFARGGIAAAGLPPRPGSLFAGPEQVFLQGQRILVLRDDRHRPLVVYSHDGRHRRAFVAGRGTEPGNSVVWAPAAALQFGKLLLGWTVPGTPSAFELRRLLVRGRP